METAGALRIFERSCATKGLKYKDMLGDGDSSTYSAILERKPYGEDCIPIKLECIEEMAKAVKASLFHVASTEENPQHHLCPKGEHSWCGYQRDFKTYKHKNGISKPIVELVEPIFDDLADPALLKKCTHGLTQNPNECLNGII
jgi:hypothetical protein